MPTNRKTIDAMVDYTIIYARTPEEAMEHYFSGRVIHRAQRSVKTPDGQILSGFDIAWINERPDTCSVAMIIREDNAVYLTVEGEDQTEGILAALKNNQNLWSLELNGSGIRNIELLEDLPDLHKLKLNDLRSVDITYVPHIRSLKKLELSNCNIHSLEGIQTLHSLNELILFANAMPSLPNLGEMPSLHTLYCVDDPAFRKGSELADIAGLAKLKKLQNLVLDDNPYLEDIAPISGLSTLTKLSVRGCPIENYGSLSNMHQLKEFTSTTFGSDSNDFAVLKKMQMLEKLNVCLSNAQDSEIQLYKVTLPNIRELCLYGKTSLANSSWLGNFASLRNLWCRYLIFKDLSGLTKLPYLTDLAICIEPHQVSMLFDILSEFSHLSNLFVGICGDQLDIEKCKQIFMSLPQNFSLTVRKYSPPSPRFISAWGTRGVK